MNTIEIKQHWRPRLNKLFQVLGFYGVQDGSFYKGEYCTYQGISKRTVLEGLKKGMTVKSFHSLGTLLGFATVDEFTAALDAPVNEFRDPQHKSHQEIPLSQRPHPAPGYEMTGPIEHLNLDCEFVEGWTVRLRVGARYKLEFERGTCSLWPETETVLYNAVPAGLLPDRWERFQSTGAITTVGAPLEFIAPIDHLLVTCWGKRIIASDCPWLSFSPVDASLDSSGIEFIVRFSSPPVDNTVSDSRPTVRISALI